MTWKESGETEKKLAEQIWKSEKPTGLIRNVERNQQSRPGRVKNQQV